MKLGQLRTYFLIHKLKRERDGGRGWGLGWQGLLKPQSPPLATHFFQKRLYLWILVKVIHQLGTKHSNGLWGHSHFKSLCSDHGMFPETSYLMCTALNYWVSKTKLGPLRMPLRKHLLPHDFLSGCGIHRICGDPLGWGQSYRWEAWLEWEDAQAFLSSKLVLANQNPNCFSWGYSSTWGVLWWLQALRSPCLLTYTGLVHLQNPELVVARSSGEFSGASPSNTPSYLTKTSVKDRCLWAVRIAFAICGQKTWKLVLDVASRMQAASPLSFPTLGVLGALGALEVPFFQCWQMKCRGGTAHLIWCHYTD